MDTQLWLAKAMSKESWKLEVVALHSFCKSNASKVNAIARAAPNPLTSVPMQQQRGLTNGLN
eukprot:scaffold24_cov128-Cylindrotheca_fusiformis.AAC.5